MPKLKVCPSCGEEAPAEDSLDKRYMGLRCLVCSTPFEETEKKPARKTKPRKA